MASLCMDARSQKGNVFVEVMTRRKDGKPDCSSDHREQMSRNVSYRSYDTIRYDTKRRVLFRRRSSSSSSSLALFSKKEYVRVQHAGSSSQGCSGLQGKGLIMSEGIGIRTRLDKGMRSIVVGRQARQATNNDSFKPLFPEEQTMRRLGIPSNCLFVNTTCHVY
jgi:hypothetical protein